MATANPKLTEDIEQALTASPNGAIQVDGAGGAIYWLLTQDAKLVREQVLDGVADANSGNVDPWDAEQIKVAGRHRMEDQR